MNLLFLAFVTLSHLASAEEPLHVASFTTPYAKPHKLERQYFLKPKADLICEMGTTGCPVLIWLPGYGESPEKYVPMAKYLQKKIPQLYVHILTPPVRFITISAAEDQQAQDRSAWFDLITHDKMGTSEVIDATAILESRRFVEEIVDRVVENPSEGKHDIGKPNYFTLDKVIIGGLDQGAAVALFAGLTLRGIGGVVAAGGFLPLQKRLPDEMRHVAGNKDITKVLFLHGSNDKVVPIKAAQQAKKFCHANGISARLKTLQGAEHYETLNKKSWKTIVKFIKKKVLKQFKSIPVQEAEHMEL